jgi:hypothetical protein
VTTTGGLEALFMGYTRLQYAVPSLQTGNAIRSVMFRGAGYAPSSACPMIADLITDSIRRAR